MWCDAYGMTNRCFPTNYFEVILPLINEALTVYTSTESENNRIHKHKYFSAWKLTKQEDYN